MEGLTDVFILKRTCLKKLNPVIIRYFFPLLIRDTSILHINFVPDQQSHNISPCILIDRLIPGRNVVQGFLIIAGVGKDDPRSALVIGLRNILKSVLASCVSGRWRGGWSSKLRGSGGNFDWA